MQVLVSRDRVWRVEIRAVHGGCTLTMHGGKVLEHASLDQVVAYLLKHGVVPDRDLVED